MTQALETAIEAAWGARADIDSATTGFVREAVEETLAQLDSGALRVAEKRGTDWHVNQWAKKAVLLSFRLNDMEQMSGGPQGSNWWDKVPTKFEGWGDNQWRAAGFRAVPGAIVRRSAFIGKGAVLMPSFVNLGAHVGEGTMVDTWATVGSCAQIGKNVHLSGGVGIGGVLNPCRPAPPSSRTTASSAPGQRWSKAASSARVRSWGWASSSASPPRSSIARPAR